MQAIVPLLQLVLGEVVEGTLHTNPKYSLLLAELTKSASYATSMHALPPLYRFPFRSCSAVQDEGLVCGSGADSNAGLSRKNTTTATSYHVRGPLLQQ